MSQPLSPPVRPLDRGYVAAEWVLLLGLAGTLAWTTLCLGGYLAQTMAVSAGLVFGLGTLGAILWAVGRPGEPRSVNWAVFLPLPFLAFALASVVGWAPAGWLAWREWALWFQMWLVFALVLHFAHSRARLAVMVGVLVLLAIAGVAMALYQRFSAPDWLMLGRHQVRQFQGRSSGMFGIPNSLAGLFELILPACLVLIFSRSSGPRTKIICGWLAVLLFYGITLTGSRGGWIALALALLLWPLLAMRRRKRVVWTAAVACSIMVGAWATYLGSDYARARMQPLIEGNIEPSRPILWTAAVRIWRDHPWLGSGAGAYNIVFDQHRPAGFWDEPDWTHNDYLNVLSDYGTLGFGLWLGAGLTLAWCGWRAVRRNRSELGTGPHPGSPARWKLGLLLGLIAYALHLAVDFHTRIPALAYAAAVVAALLLREEPWLQLSVRRPVAWLGGGLVTLAAGVLLRTSIPAYQAEGLRAEARRVVDRHAGHPEGDLDSLVAAARSELTRAVRLDPANGQAWSDLSYVVALNVSGVDRPGIGRFAELAADRALALCPINAEFWVRRGVALDVQLGRSDAEQAYLQATRLAPNNARWWYYYAFHLQRFPERKADAQRALETCLTLDPFYPPAEGLRRRISADR